jgi:predicted metalloenzyme YecM
MGKHPALDVHEQNPSQRWHQPIGIFGDDARYTLAGRKIYILLLSSVLQKIERNFAKIFVCLFLVITYCSVCGPVGIQV